MELKSVIDIIEFFGIDSNNPEEIRKILKQKMAEIHPDKSGGTFPNRKQEEDYNQLNDAIDFLKSNLNTDVTISSNDLKNALQKLDEFELLKTRIESITENKFSNQLNTSIDTSIINFKNRHFAYTITPAIISIILPIIWGFPALISKNDTLKNLIPNSVFITIWPIFLLLTALTWLYTKMLEKRDDVFKKSYNLESTQNSIFKLFLSWLYASRMGTAISFPDDKKTYSFTKDNLVDFIFNYYVKLSKLVNSSLSSREIDKLFQLHVKDTDDLVVYKKPQKHLYLIFNEPGEIDIDLAQRLTDAIIGRLILRKVISISNNKTLSESYTYIKSDLD